MNQENKFPYGIANSSRVQTRAEMDYVKGSTLYHGSRAASILVTSQSDLSELTGYEPGAVAYTAGFGSMWQLAANGNWVEI